MSCPPRVHPRTVLALLFLSGVTGLVYELVWSKHLSNVLGNSGQAYALVLATFMGGLALGAFLFGRLADKVSRPLRLYGVLEVGVGLYALAFPKVLELLGELYLRVAPALPLEARLAPRLGLAALALLVPTLLMGGTVPALVKYASRTLADVQPQLARLYAVNSLGAALGVLWAGLWAVPAWGLSLTTTGAAALNVLVGAAAWWLGGRGEPAVTADAVTADAEAGRVYSPFAVRAALIGVAIGGFTAMLYQVSWIRILTLTLGSSPYAFTLIVAAFILGIGLGSTWLSLRPPRDPLRTFARLQLGLLLAVCVAVPLYARLPWIFWGARNVLRRTEEAWPLYQALTFGFCLAVLLLPTLFMGAAFPAAARVATASVSKLGRQLGGVYVWNTAGTVTGSALGGLWLLPTLGLEGCIALGLCLTLGSAALAHAASWRGGVRLARLDVALLGALLLGGAMLGQERGASALLANAAPFREWGPSPGSFQEYRAWVWADIEELFRRDDTFATVVVGQVASTGERFLRLNGKPDASTQGDLHSNSVLGHLGPLLHPGRPRRVLLVGAGSGVSAGALLAHEQVERVDLVEISPAVVEALPFFAEANEHALDDPRLKIHVEDAKTFMALEPRRYDLIVSQPSNPWMAGVAGLFTREYFAHAREHLAKDGLYIQWLQSYETSREMVSLTLRTVRDVFPHATSWQGSPIDLFIVASTQPLEVDLDRLAERMRAPKVARSLARHDVVDLASLLALQVHGPQGQLALAGDGPLNTDDRNLLEYAAPRAYFTAVNPATIRDQRRLPGADGELHFSRYLAQGGLDERALASLHRMLDRESLPRDPLVRSAAEAWLRAAPESSEATLAAARSRLAQEDLGAAQALLEPLIESGSLDPSLGALYLQLVRSIALRQQTLLDPGRDRMLARAARLLEGNPDHQALREAHEALCRTLEGMCARVPKLDVAGPTP